MAQPLDKLFTMKISQAERGLLEKLKKHRKTRSAGDVVRQLIREEARRCHIATDLSQEEKWLLWSNGKEHRLTAGKDFEYSIPDLRRVAVRIGKRMGLKASVNKINAKEVLVRFSPLES